MARRSLEGIDLEGRILGVFGTDQSLKQAFLNSVAKKSEAEGAIVLYHRVDAGVPYSFLDDAQYPERVQGYTRIASLSDYAFYLVPKYGKLSAPDGELAVLLDSLGLDGTLVSVDEPVSGVSAFFKGLRLERYPAESRSTQSPVIDLSKVTPAPGPKGTLVYIDRAFSVKGVGVVVLGFVVSGEVSVHDQLRLIPSSSESKRAEVRGIQVHDVDHDTVGRGVRVGLSLRGVELKDLDKVSWLDDGSLATSDKLTFDYRQSGFYKQAVDGRDMHLQLPGEVSTCKLKLEGARVTATLPSQSPVWEGMRVSVIDLNGKGLRIAGGGVCRI